MMAMSDLVGVYITQHSFEVFDASSFKARIAFSCPTTEDRQTIEPSGNFSKRSYSRSKAASWIGLKFPNPCIRGDASRLSQI